MPFEFISDAEKVAGQQQLWGIVIGIAGILLIGFAMMKGKPAIFNFAGLALLAVSGYYFYQHYLLQQQPGQWEIRIDDHAIDWRSPNEDVDKSFHIQLVDIDFIDRSAKGGTSDPGNVYHIIDKTGVDTYLNPVSGVDLDKFAEHLSGKGIEIKSTGKYRVSIEQRNK